MKMFNVNTRAIASFVLAIFLMCTSVVLIAWACDSLKNAMEDRGRDYEDAKREVRELEEKGLVSSMHGSAVQGAVSTGAAGLLTGVYVGSASSPATGGVSMPVAIGIGVGIGATSGYVGGSVSGAFSYYDDLQAAKDNVETYRKLYAEAQMVYEHCLNPPAKYTYTDPNTGYVYEFCATMYGSDEAAYNAYWDFIESRGHPGHGD